MRFGLAPEGSPLELTLAARRDGLWIPAADWSPEHDEMMSDDDGSHLSGEDAERRRQSEQGLSLRWFKSMYLHI